MAGGRSSRMGNDKGLIHFNGKPLVQYAIELLQTFCADLKINTSNSAYNKFGFPLIQDQYPGLGPMAGLHAAIKNSKTSHVLILPCDMPFVRQEFLHQLIAHTLDYEAVVASEAGMMVPVCGCYNIGILNKLEFALQQKKLKFRTFVEELDYFLVESETLNMSGTLRSINAPDQLNPNKN